MTQYKLVVDCEAGDTKYVSLAKEELEKLEQDRADALKKLAEQEALEAEKEALKVSARAKLIAGEPLTAEEAAVIVL